MHISTIGPSETHQPTYSAAIEQKRGLIGIAIAPDSIESGDPCEDCIRSMIFVMFAPILVPVYTMLSLLSIMMSIAMMFIIAQAILVIAVSLFVIFK